MKLFISHRNSVTGWGKVRGRKVFVTADDFSVRGGHADGGIGMKAPYGEVGGSGYQQQNLMQILYYLDFGAEGESAPGIAHNSVFPSPLTICLFSDPIARWFKRWRKCCYMCVQNVSLCASILLRLLHIRRLDHRSHIYTWVGRTR